MTIAYFQAATRLSFGPGVLAEIGSDRPAAGLRKALIVTDIGLCAPASRTASPRHWPGGRG